MSWYKAYLQLHYQNTAFDSNNTFSKFYEQLRTGWGPGVPHNAITLFESVEKIGPRRFVDKVETF